METTFQEPAVPEPLKSPDTAKVLHRLQDHAESVDKPFPHAGDNRAMNEAQTRGNKLFVSIEGTQCHNGLAIDYGSNRGEVSKSHFHSTPIAGGQIGSSCLGQRGT